MTSCEVRVVSPRSLPANASWQHIPKEEVRHLSSLFGTVDSICPTFTLGEMDACLLAMDRLGLTKIYTSQEFQNVLKYIT
jgi:hypothetical protein